MPAIALGTMRVLLIEDDDGDALLVEEMLAESAPDVELLRSRSLREARIGSRPQIDCVLLDLGLPDVVGLDSVARVRAAAPDIAVIVLTGLDNAAAGTAAVDAGAQDYLVKGTIDGRLLARAIRYAIGRRQAERDQQRLRIAQLLADENARLQRGLVPRPIVADPSIRIASRYRPGRRRALLGGDFFDVVETDDGTLHALVGDVCGRGPDEAALGASLRIAWRALTLCGAAAGAVLRTLQSVIEHERQIAGTFATLCTLDVQPDRRAVTVTRAGHPPPILLHGGGVVRLPDGDGGPPIGAFAEVRWPTERFELPAAWSLLLYTDGLIEGRVNDGRERLGEDGLRRLAGDYVGAVPGWPDDPGGLLDALIARATELNGEELTDDVAALLIGSLATASAH